MNNSTLRLAALSLVALKLAACGGGEDKVASSASALSANELALTVQETAGVARQGEVVRSGVPLPRNLDVKSTSGLAVVDGANRAVPAEFEVLARWNAGRDQSAAPIQWLLVTFPASVTANGASNFRLVVNGSVSNPAPARALSLSQAGDRITIDTGAAKFVVDGAASSLFSEISTGGAAVAGAADLSGTVDGRSVRHATKRRVIVEHQGPLSAVVVVEGAYDLPETGGGGLGSRRRYTFTAGSPTAIVRHSVAFEGDKCMSVNGVGSRSCGQPNGLLVTKLRDSMSLSIPGGTVQAIGARSGQVIQGTGTASVRQQLRASRTAQRAFSVDVAGQRASGEAADGAVVAVTGNGKTVAIALDHMHYYEPQALRAENGSISIDLVDDKAWIGARQGIFATFAVSAIASAATRADLERLTWAPVNAPLRAWPSARMFAHSKAVGEIPVGTLPAGLEGYDTLMARVLDDTITRREEVGLFGITTFGSVPRDWGGPNSGLEVECSGDDPTPNEAWDNAYWCATWTDYHNGMNNAAVRAMRTGEVKYLDEISQPAALRMMHTQVFQCSPEDGYFYCGQAPAGYGGFRADFNSSHAYFDNLMTYYWLTGDRTVVETMERGAKSMRNYLCSKRPEAACSATDAPVDAWAQISGRTASQWFNAFRFVGLASDDASFLDDYRSGLARAVTQHYVEAQQNGQSFGFWTGGSQPVTASGSYSTDQLWMASMYDMNNLYRLQMDTEDAAIGAPAIQPSRVISSWARTLKTFGPSVSGDGSAATTWPNALSFSTSGARVDGVLSSVGANSGGSDPVLYDTGKADLIGVLLRGGQTLNDDAMIAMGRTMTEMTINSAMNDGTPINKRQGLFLAQLHAAVARLTPEGEAAATVLPVTEVQLTEEAENVAADLAAPSEEAPQAPASYDEGVILDTSFDGEAAVETPEVGPSGAAFGITAQDFVGGESGSGLEFVGYGQRASYRYDQASLRNLMQSGEISFSYKPAYSSDDADDTPHTLVVIGDPYNPPALIISDRDTLSVSIIDQNWNETRVETEWRAPVLRAGEFAKITARWDMSATEDGIQLYVNDEPVYRTQANGVGMEFGNGPMLPVITVGSYDAFGSYGAEGVIDNLVVRSN